MRPVSAGSPAPVHAFSLSCVASYDAAVWQGAPRDQRAARSIPPDQVRGRCCPFSCEDRPPLSPLPPCPILFTRLARECSTHALGRRNPSTKGGWHQPSLMPSFFRKASKVSSRSYGRGAQAHVQGFGLKAFAPFAFRERFRFPGRQGPPHTALATFSFHSKRGGQKYETARSQ